MAFSFHFKVIESSKSRYLSACDRLIGQLRSAEHRINKDSAESLQQQLIGNITSQHFAYAPYSDRYAEWKREYGRGKGSTDFWVLFGDLLKAIKVSPVSWRGKAQYFVGIRPGIFDSGGKSWLGQGDRGPAKEILEYALLMEKGGQNGRQPARPLFEPTQDEFAVSERRGRILNQSLMRVAQSWK